MWEWKNEFFGKVFSLRRRNEVLLREGLFLNALAEYFRLPKGARQQTLSDLPAALATIVTHVEQQGDLGPHRESIDWNDLYVLEAKVLDVQSGDRVRRRLWEVRARYARLVGAERQQQYLASKPPDETAAEAELRADLSALLSAFHATYSITLLKEKLRKGVSKRLNWIASIICGIAISLAAASWFGQSVHPDPRPLVFTGFLVIVAGVAGSFLSAQQRLQSQGEGDPIIQALGLWQFLSSAQLAMVAGGIFAIVLWLMMLGGLIQGDFFPNLANGAVPVTAKDWAKLMVWSFVAGFAERLVPNALDRLANNSEKVIVAGTPASPDPQRDGERIHARRPGATGAGQPEGAGQPVPAVPPETGRPQAPLPAPVGGQAPAG